MNRRLMIMALAAASAGPALAQATPPMGMTNAPTSAGPAKMGQAEMDNAMKTAMAGMASLQMADIGLKKAQNAMLKQFAQFEHDEQMTISEILKSMDPKMTPPTPDAQTAQMIEKLNAMQPGAEFDRQFIAGQLDGHHKLLAIQEDYIKSGRNREHLTMAKLARGMIKEHLALLNHIKQA
jgi:putative membrane protein